MAEYVKITNNEDRIDLWFSIDDSKVFAIGEKMYEIDNRAYMNGYNWEAFFKYYLAKTNPDVLINMDLDSEASAFVVCYDANKENEERAQTLEKIIIALIENEDELYRIIREEAQNIEWD